MAARLRPAMHSTLIVGCGSFLSLLLILSSNPFLLKLYRLSGNPISPAFYARLGGEYKSNHRAAFRYVSQHLSPGDGLATRATAVCEFYVRKPANYSTNTMLRARITYDGGLAKAR